MVHLLIDSSSWRYDIVVPGADAADEAVVVVAVDRLTGVVMPTVV